MCVCYFVLLLVEPILGNHYGPGFDHERGKGNAPRIRDRRQVTVQFLQGVPLFFCTDRYVEKCHQIPTNLNSRKSQHLVPKYKIYGQKISAVESKPFNVGGSDLEDSRATHAGAEEDSRWTCKPRGLLYNRGLGSEAYFGKVCACLLLVRHILQCLSLQTLMSSRTERCNFPLESVLVCLFLLPLALTRAHAATQMYQLEPCDCVL